MSRDSESKILCAYCGREINPPLPESPSPSPAPVAVEKGCHNCKWNYKGGEDYELDWCCHCVYCSDPPECRQEGFIKYTDEWDAIEPVKEYRISPEQAAEIQHKVKVWKAAHPPKAASAPVAGERGSGTMSPKEAMDRIRLAITWMPTDRYVEQGVDEAIQTIDALISPAPETGKVSVTKEWVDKTYEMIEEHRISREGLDEILRSIGVEVKE